MKLILAIINNDDSAAVVSNLTKEGFSATKLATTGGFLMSGNTTFLIGVEDEKVEKAITIISKCSKKRKQAVTSGNAYSGAGTDYNGNAVEVNLGGATVFVMNIERFEKV